VLLLFALLGQAILNAIQGYMVQKVGQKVTAAIRDDLFDHVTALAMRFFDRTPIGKLITPPYQ
jgi:ATP-binding cassette, subfamily B, multidrug efflux pump